MIQIMVEKSVFQPTIETRMVEVRKPELLVHLVSRKPYRYERFVVLPAIPPPGSLISSENEDDLPTFRVIGVSILAHTVDPEDYDEREKFEPAHILVTVEPA